MSRLIAIAPKNWRAACALLAAGLALAGAPLAHADPTSRTVVVLVFDGFAPAVVDAFATPALDRMRREGASTHRLEPAFPTISLINGVTLSTGCWPEHHGIVTNLFLDPERGVYDHDRDADWLTGCEHLHQAAERQGVRTAAIGWYGASSRTRGKLATWVEDDRFHCRRELAAAGDLARADEIVRLLRAPDAERPRLVLGYLCGPDGPEHYTGMDSEETRAAVERSDAIVGRVMAALETLAPRPAALFVTTDHGMVPVTTVVNVERILLNHGIDARFFSSGTTSFIYLAEPAQADAAARALAGYEEFEVLRKGALPAYAHLGSGPRVPELILSAHAPYFIEDVGRWPSWLRWLGPYGPEFLWAGVLLKATHGYPVEQADVAGVLYAWGDGIAKGRDAGVLRAIDLHPTVTRLLDIEPGNPVDGEVAGSLLADR